MLDTSPEYRKAMVEAVRPRGFARISYGIINTKADENTITFSKTVDWSNGQLINEFQLSNKTYATFEKDRFKTKLNSGFKFKPLNPLEYNTDEHYISEVLSGENKEFLEAKPYVDVVFDNPVNIYGLTFTFDKAGGTYPTDFEITIYDKQGQILKNETITNNKEIQFIYFLELFDVQRVNVVFYKMKQAYQRLRIDKLEYGIYQVFTNKDFDSSKQITHTREISPVSIDLSNSQLQFTILNKDNEYNALNPTGLWRFIEENQPVKVEFGREIGDTIEWLETDNMVLNDDIRATETNVTFKAVDRFTILDMVYKKSIYRPKGITFYELAKNILEDAGLSKYEYVIDERLKLITTKAVIEPMKVKEALQILANASNSIVFADSKGRINIQVAFDPITTVTDNGHSSLSNTQNVVETSQLPDVEYANLDQDFMETQERKIQIIAPREKERRIRVGYIGDQVCNIDGSFNKQPMITIEYSLPINVFQIPITFNNVSNEYAIDFDVIFYDELGETDRVEVRGNNQSTYFLQKAVVGVIRIELVIMKWSGALHRAVVNQIGQGRINDFYMDFNTSSTKPIVNKTRLIKELQMSYYNVNLSDEKVDVKINNNKSKKLEISHEAMTDITVSVTSGKVLRQQHYAYVSYVEVDTLNISEIKLTGTKIEAIEQNLTLPFNLGGKIEVFKNPLITDAERAKSVGDWIYDFLLKNSALNISYRGNPELEPFDTIYVESQFNKYTPARITRTKITFGNGTKGDVEVVKI